MMNIRLRTMWRAIKHHSRSSDERIQSIIEFIDKYGNYNFSTKNRMKQYFRFKKFAMQMARSCPMICNTKKKNYHTSVEVKL